MCQSIDNFSKRTFEINGTSFFKEHYSFGLGLAVVLKENKYGSIHFTGSIGPVGWPGAYGGWWSADAIKIGIFVFLTRNMTELKQLRQGYWT